MKIVLNKSGYFELSITALDELADIINQDAQLHKYYVAIDSFADDDDEAVTLEKEKTYWDSQYNTIILTNQTFDGTSKDMSLEDYYEMENISIKTIFNSFNYNMRDDERLVAVVEKLGHDAHTYNSRLEVVEIPDGLSWKILYNGGVESLIYGEKDAMDKINIL